jgi:nucleoside-diphosphate-sugar epimerase
VSEKVGLIFGVSGIAGRAIAERLSSEKNWAVIGVSRHAPDDLPAVHHVACDLQDRNGCRDALANAPHATHAFFATWSRQADETENCRVNGEMFRNAIEAAADSGELRHVALVTGLKHYLGSFDSYAAQELDTPFTEDQPRVPGENFYYTQEDILFDAARRYGFSWSVARPHTIIGYAPGNAMNLGTSLAVYATLCRESGRPFQFPGSPQQYNGLVDMTAADLLAEHLLWEATTEKAANTAFNVVNGDIFRWRKMWGRIADYFGIQAAPYPGRAEPLADSLANAARDWDQVVLRYQLRPNPIDQVAVWWHVDADLGRTQECLTDMSRSRKLGFVGYRATWPALRGLFERLRARRIIP